MSIKIPNLYERATVDLACYRIGSLLLGEEQVKDRRKEVKEINETPPKPNRLRRLLDDFKDKYLNIENQFKDVQDYGIDLPWIWFEYKSAWGEVVRQNCFYFDKCGRFLVEHNIIGLSTMCCECRAYLVKADELYCFQIKAGNKSRTWLGNQFVSTTRGGDFRYFGYSIEECDEGLRKSLKERLDAD